MRALVELRRGSPADDAAVRVTNHRGFPAWFLPGFAESLTSESTIQWIADSLAMAPKGTPWAFEGSAYQFVREQLCLSGFEWRAADVAAAWAVGAARELNGTPCPEGWDDNDVLVSGRCTVCRQLIAIVAGKLYCSRRCKSEDNRRRSA